MCSKNESVPSGALAPHHGLPKLPLDKVVGRFDVLALEERPHRGAQQQFLRQQLELRMPTIAREDPSRLCQDGEDREVLPMDQ